MSIGILFRHASILDVGNPFHGVPVQLIEVLLCHIRTEHLELEVRKFLVQGEAAASIRFILSSRTLAYIRLVDGMIEFVSYTILRGKLQYCLVKVRTINIILTHIQGHGILSAPVTSKVSHLPYLAITLRVVLAQCCRRCLLVTDGEMLFRAIDTCLRLRIQLKNNVETTVGGIQYVFYLYHIYSDLLLLQKYFPEKIPENTL